MNNILSKLIEYSIKHGDATENGDYKAANKNYNLIIKCLSNLKNEDNLISLKELLTNESISVKIWAATYLLPIEESIALPVLEEISYGDGMRAFAAKITVEEWKKKRLKLVF